VQNLLKNRDQISSYFRRLIMVSMRKILTLIGLFCIINMHGQGQWNVKTGLKGKARNYTSTFSIGTRLYTCLGNNVGFSPLKDLWQYDPATDAWTQKADFGGPARWGAFVFVVGSKAYIGCGRDSLSSYSDFWEYDAPNDSWNQLGGFSGGNRRGATAFVINGKGYAGFGWDGTSYFNDLYEYNVASDSWTQKADFPESGRNYPVSFVIANKGYVGTGNDGTPRSNFYKYTPSSDSWSTVTNSISGVRSGAMAFAINNYAYVAGGNDGTNALNDFQRFNPNGETWQSYVKMPRYLEFGSATVAGGIPYIVCGDSALVSQKTLLSFDTFDISCSLSASSNLCPKASFAVNYISNTTFANDNEFSVELSDAYGIFYSTPLIVGSKATSTSSSIQCTVPSGLSASSGYRVRILASSPAFTGYVSADKLSLLDGPPVNLTIVGKTGLCAGDSVKIAVPNTANCSYQWLLNGVAINGKTSYTGYAKTSGFYQIVVTKNSCIDTSTKVNVSVLVNPPSALTASGPTTFCEGDSVQLELPSSSGFQYEWRKDGNIVSGSITNALVVKTSGKYKLTITNGGNCSFTSNETQVTVLSAPTANINSPIDSVTACSGKQIMLTADSNADNSFQWYQNGQPIAGAMSKKYIASMSGLYQVKVSNTIGCSSWSKNVKVTLTPNFNPGSVIGLDQVTKLSSSSYSVPLVNGITYVWAVSGGNVTSGQGTNASSIQWGNPGPGLIKVFASSGCTDTSTLVVGINYPQGFTSISNTSTFHVYPNPCTNKIYIPTIKEGIYKLVSMDGKSMYLGTTSSDTYEYQTFDISSLKNGLYLIQVISKEGLLSSTFVKE
jgi:hypothetical protein